MSLVYVTHVFQKSHILVLFFYFNLIVSLFKSFLYYETTFDNTHIVGAWNCRDLT